MQFNDKLKEIRQLNNWSQQQFADKLELKRSTYAEWEKDIIPTFDIVVKIAAVANVSILDLARTIDENLSNSVKPEEPREEVAVSIDFLKGRLEGKEDLLAEKEARRQDAVAEKEKYFVLIEKYLIGIQASSKDISADISAMNEEMSAAHRAMMDSIDKAAGLEIGTTAAAADIVEIASQKGRQKRDKKAGAGKQSIDHSQG